MTTSIQSLLEIADQFSALVFDQWGVLHNGSHAYPKAAPTLERLRSLNLPMAVLSNSGKRATSNLRRIGSMGFDRALFRTIMTSGEALWQDLASNQLARTPIYAVERKPGDARIWAAGLDLNFVTKPDEANVLLLMGLADQARPSDFRALLNMDFDRIICSNPDRHSPRDGGKTVLSPGFLGQIFESRGQNVTYYGKPHRAVFQAVARDLRIPLSQILMVGDSLEHDIAGGKAAGCATLLVTGGLYAGHFASGGDLPSLVKTYGVQPDFLIDSIQ